MGEIFTNGAPRDWLVDPLIRLVIAALLGGLIGAEREHHGRSAGLRTLGLVSVGSALAMLVSLYFEKAYASAGFSPTVRVDPARIAYGVMGGVGFLGAGSIIRDAAGIRGLTTAASLWCTAAVGLAVGFGMYPAALGATGVVLILLWALRSVDRRIPAVQERRLVLDFASAADGLLERVLERLADRKVDAVVTGHQRNLQAGTTQIVLHLTGPQTLMGDPLFEAVADLPDLKSLRLDVPSGS